MAKAAATGMSRRQVLRGLLAVGGSGVLVHLTRGESDARLSRCCRQEKRFAKQFCSAFTGGTCPNVIDFSCEKTGPGQCEVNTFECATKDGALCV
jgi:hypothetical protein